MATGSCSSTDLTRQLDRIERELKSLRNDIDSNYFKLNANLNGLSDFLGKGKISWVEIAGMIASMVAAVAGIANIIQIWAQGAYLSKILAASEQAAKDSNYTAKEVQIWARGAYFSKILQSTQAIQGFLENFGNSTIRNFQIIQEEVRRLSPQNISGELARLSSQIEAIPQKVGNIPAIREINFNAKEVTQEIIREIIKISGEIGDTITQAINPLEKIVRDIPRQTGLETRDIILRTDTTRTNIKLEEILGKLGPLALIPANLAGLDTKINKLDNDLRKQINGIPAATATANCNSGCSKAGAAARSRLEAGQNALNNKLDALNAGLNASQLTLLKKIDGTTTRTLSQLGNPLNGGISGKLNRIGDVLSQSPIISWINLLVTLHNAGQLSASLVQTLGDTLSLGLNTFVFKDSEGQGIDVNKIIGDSVQGWIIKIIGIENYTTFKRELALWNNVYRSAANIVDTVRSIGDSTNAIASIAAENSGKIGNALLKDRVISEDSFNWMPENVTPSSAVLDRLNNLDDAASALAMVIGETASLVDAKRELDEQAQKFEENLENLDPRTRPNNKPIKESQDASKSVSHSNLIDETTITGIGEV